MACIGEPISWLRLETFASTRNDAAIAAHVASCAACAQCLDEITRDVVALPPLAVPAATPSRVRWWMWAVPALAAVAILVVVVRPRPQPPRDNLTAVKGVGAVVLGVVRERDGAIRTDATTFRIGDRWKVIVTCPPGKAAWIDVAVVEAGADTADYPIAPAHVACGNEVVVPGAFELIGDKPNQVCVRVGVTAAASRGVPSPGDANVACITIRPE